MSEENQAGNQLQASSENQAGASNEGTAQQPQAVEPTPKPEPSYGLEKRESTERTLRMTTRKRD